MLVIDKYVQRLIKLADRHTIIERGRVVWQGDSAQLAADRACGTAILACDFSPLSTQDHDHALP